MRVLRSNVGSFKQDIQIETSIQKLAFIVTSALVIFTEAIFDKMFIEVSVTTAQNGSKVILPKMSLRDAFNMAAMGEGFFVWGLSELKGSIVVSEQGSLILQNGDSLSVSYEGFPADAITDLYAMDSPLKATTFNHIEEIVITGTRDLAIASKTDLYFPVTDAAGNGVEKVQIQYADKTVTIDETELRFINDTVNDISCVRQEALSALVQNTDVVTIPQALTAGQIVSAGIYPVKFGYDRLLRLEVSAAYSIIITPKTKNPISIYTATIKSI